MSGGTFETLTNTHVGVRARSKFDYDPLLKKLGKDEKSEYLFKYRN